MTSSRLNPKLYEAWPSEGGHVEFAPRSRQQCEMTMYMRDKFGGRVSTERIVSGKGIVNVYDYLAHARPDEVEPTLDHKIRAEDEGALHVAKVRVTRASRARGSFVLYRGVGCARSRGRRSAK